MGYDKSRQPMAIFRDNFRERAPCAPFPIKEELTMTTLQRRRFLIAGAALAASLPAGMGFTAETKKRMRIGVIGSGRIGGTLGGLLAKAGHEVMFSDRDLEQAKQAAASAG